METLLARAAAQDLAILLHRAAAQVLAILLARAAAQVVEGGALVFAATMNATQVVSHLISYGNVAGVPEGLMSRPSPRAGGPPGGHVSLRPSSAGEGPSVSPDRLVPGCDAGVPVGLTSNPSPVAGGPCEGLVPDLPGPVPGVSPGDLDSSCLTASAKTARIYIEDGLACLAQLRLSLTQVDFEILKKLFLRHCGSKDS